MSYMITRYLSLICGLTLSASAAFALTLEWKPVDPADLSLKEPRVEKDAGAEAILWETWVADELHGLDFETVLTNYIRIKIFNEHGRDSHATIDIPFAGKVHITDVAGRTIKPDGSILELKKDAVFERTIVKAGGLKVKAVSFAMPGVEPGDIIEYHYREHRDNEVSNYAHLYFQQDVPIQLVRYHIKPLNDPRLPYAMRTLEFHCDHTPFVPERDGYYTTTLSNVPAFLEEPQMPPEDEVRSWMLVYYTEDRKLTPDKYWKDYGREQYKAFKGSTKVNGDVRKTADEITSGAANDEDKLRRLFEYCRTKIKNTQRDVITAEERADTKLNKTPADTINQGAGSGFDIDMAFAALASAAGFDARIARLGDRSASFFSPLQANAHFLRAYNVAINIDGKWRFFDPANTYVPYGMLRWAEEGQKALVPDNKEPEFVDTPLSGPEKSVSKRTGFFRLNEEGTLEGQVTLTYTGHPGAARKFQIESDSPEQRIENVRVMIKSQMSTAEVSKISVENASDPEKPLTYSFHVKVPGYAQRTGKRLFVQLDFFEANKDAKFPNAARKYPVYFQYPWSEEDSVEIWIPAGYELEHPEGPPAIDLGKLGEYKVKIALTSDHRLVYSRRFAFGDNGVIRFPKEVYPQLKQVFDTIHEADMHALTLRQQTVGTK